MSTVKTDAITAVSANGDLSLDGLGTGGVSIASTLKMAKGGDIASASPLVIDTDGNFFDITGTTNFAAMTVEAGNFFMLQFDGALTITHGSGIEIPGGANLTTATGDRLICYATAANTVEVMSVETEAAAAGGGLIHVATVTASGATSIDFDASLSSTYDVYLIIVSEMFTQDVDVYIRTDSDGGDSFDAGSSDYSWGSILTKDDAVQNTKDVADNQINILGTSGSSNPGGAAPTEEVGFLKIWINKPSGTVGDKMILTEFFYPSADPEVMMHGHTMGRRLSSAAIDSIQILAASGNITGVARLYGITNG